MNRKTASIVFVVALFAGLVGSNAYGQTSTKVKANIPFDFHVGTQSLPAGVYTIVPLKGSTVLIRSKEGHQSAVSETNAVQTNQSSADGKLVFNRYGVFYFLSQVWTPGEEVGRKLPKTNAEQEVAGGIAPTETTIQIAGTPKK